MNTLTVWIRHHQLAAFFLITFGITWGLGFSYEAVIVQGNELLAPLVSLATCGPALAGIIISRLCNRVPTSGSTIVPWPAFIIALIVSTLVFVANNVIINHAPLSPIMVIFVAIVAVPVAYIISAVFSRVSAVHRYLASLLNVHPVWGWLLLSLLVTAGLGSLSIAVSNLAGRQSVHLSDLRFQGFDLLKMIVITFLYQIFFFNATGEEVGWRGFALPRLQAQTNPLIASLVLTFFWMTWHAFYFHATGEPVLIAEFWLSNFVRLFPATVMINWFYNRSKGSILAAGVTHAAANTVFAYMPRVDVLVHTVLIYAFSLAVILLDQMWKKLPSDHPAVIQTPELRDEQLFPRPIS